MPGRPSGADRRGVRIPAGGSSTASGQVTPSRAAYACACLSLVSRSRLHVVVAGVRLTHVQGEELDLRADVGVQPLERRTGALRHDPGDGGEGHAQGPSPDQLRARRPSTIDRRQVEVGKRLPRSCAAGESAVLEQRGSREVPVAVLGQAASGVRAGGHLRHATRPRATVAAVQQRRPERARTRQQGRPWVFPAAPCQE